MFTFNEPTLTGGRGLRVCDPTAYIPGGSYGDLPVTDAITQEAVRQLAKDLHKAEREANGLLAQIAIMRRRLEAAEEWGFKLPTSAELDPDLPLIQNLDLDEAGDQEHAEWDGSLPIAVCDLLKQRGKSMRPPEMKAALLEQGVPNSKFGANNSYFYTVLKRLQERGKIRKYGKKYRDAT